MKEARWRQKDHFRGYGSKLGKQIRVLGPRSVTITKENNKGKKRWIFDVFSIWKE